ncbi:MAG: hypothetical protein P4L16_00345 [Chlamydiales bacterium]|nr:hypothetical protein [Chlamydiales bacterium]
MSIPADNLNSPVPALPPAIMPSPPPDIEVASELEVGHLNEHSVAVIPANADNRPAGIFSRAWGGVSWVAKGVAKGTWQAVRHPIETYHSVKQTVAPVTARLVTIKNIAKIAIRPMLRTPPPLENVPKDNDIITACAESKEKARALVGTIPQDSRIALEETLLTPPIVAPKPQSPESIDAHTKLVDKERQQREKLIYNTIHFATVTVFDQKIFGNDPESTLEFYKQFANKKTLAELEENDKEAKAIQKKRHENTLKNLSPEELESAEAELSERAKKLITPRLAAYYKEVAMDLDPNKPIDPIKAYYCHIADKSTFYYCLAKVLVPIIKWFVTLVLRPNSKVDSGINHAKNELFKHFQNKDVVKQEILDLFNEAGNYFETAYKYCEEYRDIKANSQHPIRLAHPEYADRDLPTHLKVRLEEALEARTQLLAAQTKEHTDLKGSDYLNHKFNLFLEKLVNIKSGVPFIGGILDFILRRVLKPVIKGLNIVPRSLSNTFSGEGLNLTLTYNIKKILVDRLKELKNQLNQPETALLEGEEINTTFAEDTLFKTQEAVFQRFVKNLLQYLPLASVNTTNELKTALAQKPTAPSTFIGHALRSLEGFTGKEESFFDLALEKTLTDVMLSLGAGLIQNSSKGDSTLSAWTQILETANDTFDSSKDSDKRKEADILAINSELTSALSDLTQTALNKKLAELPQVTAERENFKKATQLINNATLHITHYSSSLKKIHDQITEQTTTKQVRDIEKSSFHLILSLKEYLEKLESALSNALKCPGDSKTDGVRNNLLVGRDRDLLKIKVKEVCAQIDTIRTQYLEIKETITTLKVHESLSQTIEDLHLTNSQDNTTTILQGANKSKFDHYINRLQENLSRISIAQQETELKPHIEEQQEHIQNIHKTNQEIIARDAQTEIFKKISTDITNVKNRNNLLSKRPRGDALDALKNKLTSQQNRNLNKNPSSIPFSKLTIKKQFESLIRPSDESGLKDLTERILYLNTTFNQFKQDLASYTDLLPNEYDPPKDSIKLVAEHIDALLKLQTTDTGPKKLAQLTADVQAYLNQHKRSFDDAIDKLSEALNQFSIQDRTDRNKIENALSTIERERLKTLPSQLLLEDSSIGPAGETKSYTELMNTLQACIIANRNNDPKEVDDQLVRLEALRASEQEFNANMIRVIHRYKKNQQEKLKDNLSQLQLLLNTWIHADWQHITEVNTRFNQAIRNINDIKEAFPVPKLPSWIEEAKPLLDRVTPPIRSEMQKRINNLTGHLSDMLLENNRMLLEQILMRGPLNIIAKKLTP